LVFNLIIFTNKMQLRIKVSCPCTEMIIFLTLKYIIFLCFIEYAISIVRPNFNIVPVIKQKTTNLSQVTDKLYNIMLYTSPWSGFELTASVVIGTDCIGSCIWCLTALSTVLFDRPPNGVWKWKQSTSK
jgi:hypothetical protein